MEDEGLRISQVFWRLRLRIFFLQDGRDFFSSSFDEHLLLFAKQNLPVRRLLHSMASLAIDKRAIFHVPYIQKICCVASCRILWHSPITYSLFATFNPHFFFF